MPSDVLSEKERAILLKLNENGAVWFEGEEANTARDLVLSFHCGPEPLINAYEMPGGGIMCGICPAGRALIGEKNDE